MYPDITIVLNLSVEEALARAKARGAKTEYFEKRPLLEKVRANYLALAAHDDLGKITVIDASKPPEEVLAEAVNALEINGLL
mgnify:CR=1 FL=1